MSKFEKLLIKILSGTQDKNIPFSDLTKLLETLKFLFRIKGDHHIFYRNDVEEIINLQPQGKLAKPYQVKQVRQLILKYKMAVIEND